MQARRDFLRLAAMLSGAAGVSGLVPQSIQRAYAIAPDPGSTYLDAEHVVILMQENRSFDHALGTLRGVRGLKRHPLAEWKLSIRTERIRSAEALTAIGEGKSSSVNERERSKE